MGLTRSRHARSGPLRIGFETRGALHRHRPWLLLIQGLGFDRSGWDPVTAGLQRRFRLVLMDNRGCGTSDATDRRASVPELAKDAVAVLDGAGIKRAHIAGASLGGMVAQEIAIDHPDRVNGLVLACTTPGWPSGFPMPMSSLQLLARGRDLTPEQALQQHVENALSPQTLEHDPKLVKQLVRHQSIRPSDPDTWSSLAAAGARYYGGMRRTRIKARTLILQGTADSVVDPRNARRLAERIPKASVVMLADLGHLFFWEDPDAFVQPVVSFLAPAKRGRRLVQTEGVNPVGEGRNR